MEESVFRFVPRDVRKLIFTWLGPSPLFRARARGVCLSWREDVPCEFDMFRDEKTREPEVLPVRWSLVETVIRMVLHEPDEVCARMDDLVERFLRLAPLEKYEDAYETLMVRLIGPACRLGKLSFLESLLCHAHLEESSDGILLRVNARMTLLGMFFSNACSYDRPEWLLKWRHALWSQSGIFRMRTLWNCLFLGSERCFRVLLHDLKLESTFFDCQYDRPKLSKILGARRFCYLVRRDRDKADFISNARSLPPNNLIAQYMTMPLVTGDANDVAAAVDFMYAQTGHVTTIMQARMLGKNLVHDLDEFRRGFVHRRRAQNDDDDDEGSNSDDDDDENSGDISVGSDDDEWDRDSAKCCDMHPRLFDTAGPIPSYVSIHENLLAFGRHRTRQKARDREVRMETEFRRKVRELRDHAAVMAFWDHQSKRKYVPEPAASLAKRQQKRRKHQGGVVRIRELRRAQFALGNTPRPIINPYEESLDSSEEARILAEEDELEHNSGNDDDDDDDVMEESDE